MNKVGIYHDQDLDGLACGAIMKKAHPNIQLIGYDYGRDFTELKRAIGDAEVVIMADVSVPMPQMIEIARGREQFIWIDHHASAIMDYVGNKYEDKDLITPVLKDGTAACELCWEYFFPDEEMPKGVYLLGRYDTWRKEWREGDNGLFIDYTWEDHILPFQFGMRTTSKNNIEFIISDILAKDTLSVFDTMRTGKEILSYIAKQREIIAKHPIEVELNGLKGIALNTTEFNSGTFDPIWDPEKYHFMMPFRHMGNHWKVSLYTTRSDVDCSALAKSQGGGGHRKAAGFRCTEFPFPFIK